MKKIALFSDGTGNSSSSPQKTNVWRAYQALDRSPGSGQIAFYDNGVGTSSFRPLALLGRGLGFGLARNVREIYGFLCRTYDPGDEIYGFGFSRGAFTMRVVMAMIASQGIIDRNRALDERDLNRLIIHAYRRFRQESFTPSMLSFFFRPARDLVANGWRWMRGKYLYDPEKNIRYRHQPGDGHLSQVRRRVGHGRRLWAAVGRAHPRLGQGGLAAVGQGPRLLAPHQARAPCPGHRRAARIVRAPVVERARPAARRDDRRRAGDPGLVRRRAFQRRRELSG
jgi:hypothetical protein